MSKDTLTMDMTPKSEPQRQAAMGTDGWARLWRITIWIVMAFFLLNVIFMIATVAVNSVATRWFATFLPEGFTLSWYGQAWREFQLSHVLLVTVEVIGTV